MPSLTYAAPHEGARHLSKIHVYPDGLSASSGWLPYSLRFSEKASELWAYQASIVRAAQHFEGTAWVVGVYARYSYSNWSQLNSRLHNRLCHGNTTMSALCLSDTHVSMACSLEFTAGAGPANLGTGQPHLPNPDVQRRLLPLLTVPLSSHVLRMHLPEPADLMPMQGTALKTMPEHHSPQQQGVEHM